LDAPRHTRAGLRIAFVADLDRNLVELLSAMRKLLRPEESNMRQRFREPMMYWSRGHGRA
jgi:hypothetical protein